MSAVKALFKFGIADLPLGADDEFPRRRLAAILEHPGSREHAVGHVDLKGRLGGIGFVLHGRSPSRGQKGRKKPVASSGEVYHVAAILSARFASWRAIC